MLNPILFLSAISSDMLYSMVYELDKCSISGEITDVNVELNNVCSDNIYIILDGKIDYQIQSTKYRNGFCSGGGNYTSYDTLTLPQVGDEVNYLVKSEYYRLISDEYEDGLFRLTSGEILEQEINACEVEKNDDIFYTGFMGAGIFLIIIFLILLYKRIKTLKT